MAEDFIKKLKESRLTGRSGSDFPTHLKWQMVKDAKTDKKYVICNASEGEPGIVKDRYILEHFPEAVISGIKIALETVGAQTAYIYLNPNYYNQLKPNLQKLIWNLPINLFKKPAGYLKGEETTLLNVIEDKEPTPRIKPPFPTEKGLWQRPTLINNVETLYWASRIAGGVYQNNRFYVMGGEAKHQGVFKLNENLTLKQVLEKTGNTPEFDFFLQVGGLASGKIVLSDELDQPINGLAAIFIFNKKQTDPIKLMKKWAAFFLKANCDKCAPCREGVYRIYEMLKKQELDKNTLAEIFEVMEKTSLCPLGRIAVTPFKTAIDKLLDA